MSINHDAPDGGINLQCPKCGKFIMIPLHYEQDTVPCSCGETLALTEETKLKLRVQRMISQDQIDFSL